MNFHVKVAQSRKPLIHLENPGSAMLCPLQIMGNRNHTPTPDTIGFPNGPLGPQQEHGGYLVSRRQRDRHCRA